MINFGHQRQVWPATFDQEGNPVSHQEVQQEHFEYFNKLLEEKRVEFEEALEDRCKKEDEIFCNMGFHPQAKGVCYQIGMGVFMLQASPDGIHPVQVGQIGH